MTSTTMASGRGYSRAEGTRHWGRRRCCCVHRSELRSKGCVSALVAVGSGLLLSLCLPRGGSAQLRMLGRGRDLFGRKTVVVVIRGGGPRPRLLLLLLAANLPTCGAPAPTGAVSSCSVWILPMAPQEEVSRVEETRCMLGR